MHHSMPEVIENKEQQQSTTNKNQDIAYFVLFALICFVVMIMCRDTILCTRMMDEERGGFIR